MQKINAFQMINFLNYMYSTTGPKCAAAVCINMGQLERLLWVQSSCACLYVVGS